MKTTVEIPEKLFRQAKMRAAMEGISLREFFLRGLQLALYSPAEQTPQSRVTFTVVRASQGADRLTDEMVNAALNTDEDLM